MALHHSLRPAGRARREEDVCEVSSGHRHGRRRGRPRRGDGEQLLEFEVRRAVRGQAPGSRRRGAPDRAAVVAEYQQGVCNGTLHRTDWDDELASRPAAGSSVARDQVVAAPNAPAESRLVGPLCSKTYNPYGAETLRAPAVSHADIMRQVLEARAKGTLRPAGEAELPVVTAHAPRNAPSLLTFLRGHS